MWIIHAFNAFENNEFRPFIRLSICFSLSITIEIKMLMALNVPNSLYLKGIYRADETKNFVNL